MRTSRLTETQSLVANKLKEFKEQNTTYALLEKMYSGSNATFDLATDSTN